MLFVTATAEAKADSFTRRRWPAYTDRGGELLSTVQ